MSNIGKRLNLVLSRIVKQKRIHGLFNLEGILEVTNRLESVDEEYKTRATWSFRGFIFFLFGTFFLFTQGQVALSAITGVLAVALIFIAMSFKQLDLDDEYRMFFMSALRLLKDRFNPNTEFEVNMDINPTRKEKYNTYWGPTYDEDEYIDCSDQHFERDVGYVSIPLTDGNRLTLAEKEKLIVSHKKKRYGSSEDGIVETRKHFFQTIRLHVTSEKYRCNPLPPEAGQPKMDGVMATAIHDEVIKHSRSNDTDVLEISYTVKFDDPQVYQEKMTVDAHILPDQIHKLYSLLTFVPGS
jgi:hypothetical protein